MNPWDILGIKPTDDISTIKKAYSKKLKIYHPEEDPQGFQMLREAYDHATKYAKSQKERKTKESNESNEFLITFEEHEMSDDMFSSEDFHQTINMPLPNINHFQYSVPNHIDVFETFFNDAEKLYADLQSRINVKNWETLLNSDIMWDINKRATLSQRFLDFLMSHNNLPQNIWRYLDNNFQWSNQSNLLYSNFPESHISIVVNRINCPRALGFDFLGDLTGDKLEMYLSYREKALDAFLKNETKAADKNINRAKDIFGNDPELLYLEGEYLLKSYALQDALSCFDKALNINPEDVNSLILRADIYYRQSQLDKSIIDYKKVIEVNPNNETVYPLISKCYIKTGEFTRARECLLKGIELNPKDKILRNYLINVDINIRKKLKLSLIKKPWKKCIRKELKLLKGEIKHTRKENAKLDGKNSIYINKIIIAIILLISLIISISTFFSNINNNNNKLLPNTQPIVSTPSPLDTKNTNYLNDTDISHLPPDGTSIKAKLINYYSLNTIWKTFKDKNGSYIENFIPNITLSEEYHSNNNLLYIAKINNKDILIVEANSSLKNVQFLPELDITGTIKEINPSSNVIEYAKEYMSINSREIVRDKYILIDRSTKNNSISTNLSHAAIILIAIVAYGIFKGWKSI